ncbi:helix-turn-helix domain-containing protein [Terasakiella pusilla]|uniref:helix-turn-helix domain-containing protein n=1 Tax=Terasakiella pusilla TaxID=64973 RepID=UPI00048B0FB1|nr:DNA-binding transcriptional regulator [Terasakiella pusilla]
MTRKYKSDALAALHETVEGLHKSGVINKATLKKFDDSCLEPIPEFTAEQVKAIREKEGVSQGVFARYMNVSIKTVASWEAQKPKKPSGPAAKLLDVVNRKGLEVLV